MRNGASLRQAFGQHAHDGFAGLAIYGQLAADDGHHPWRLVGVGDIDRFPGAMEQAALGPRQNA